MRIFLDTANIEQIKQAAKLGIITGVTTNPSWLIGGVIHNNSLKLITDKN